MSRLLLVAALAACSTGSASPNAATSSINTWLDGWVEARRCLVAEGENTQTGVAIAILLDRQCHTQLGELSRMTNSALGTAPKLIEGIAVQPSVPAKRAAAIDAVDKLARDLGRQVGRDVSPSTTRALPVIRPTKRLDLDGVISFGGGLIRNEEVVIDSDGKPREFLSDGGARVTNREFSTYEGKHRASAESGKHRVVVWTLKDWDHAYELDVSSDGGATWTKVTAPVGTSYVDHWQDPRTRIIEVLVRDTAKHSSIHRITADHPTPTVRTIDTVVDAPGMASCSNNGMHWRLGDTTIARFGEKALKLANFSRLGQLDCRGNTALVVSHYPDGLERCTDRCERVFSSPNNVEGRGALLEDGRWVYAVVFDQIVGVWTERAPAPAFYRLEKPAALEAVVVLGGNAVLAFNDTKSIELVTL